MSGKRNQQQEARVLRSNASEKHAENDIHDEFIEMALWFTKEIQREHMGIPMIALKKQ